MEKVAGPNYDGITPINYNVFASVSPFAEDQHSCYSFVQEMYENATGNSKTFVSEFSEEQLSQLDNLIVDYYGNSLRRGINEIEESVSNYISDTYDEVTDKIKDGLEGFSDLISELWPSSDSNRPDYPVGVETLASQAASSSSRTTTAAQTQSDGAFGWFGGTGPGDGSVAAGSGGAASHPSVSERNDNDSDSDNPGNNTYGGRDNPSGLSGGISDSESYYERYDTPGGGINEVNEDGYAACFAAGTLILMADGSERPIDEIKLEDRVMAFDGLGALEPREVTDLFVHGKRGVLNVDGILTTPEHPFLLPDGRYQSICKLAVGDQIVRADGSLHTIESIEEVEGVQTVYNFTVEGLHTYVAAGFRVHNIKPVIL
ncbi:MAG: hypothetical protein JJ866_10090, partial [Roseibium sp.]|uniref:Hint domain-containing protein n=1 Tax=Roseibium sp. TaxID=1936156 RepID=UPI001B2EE5A3